MVPVGAQIIAAAHKAPAAGGKVLLTVLIVIIAAILTPCVHRCLLGVAAHTTI